MWKSAIALTLLSIGAQAAISRNGRCGAKSNGATCQGSAYGNCCSQYSYCGSSQDHCNATTCQKNFGTCSGLLLSSTGIAPTTLRVSTVTTTQRAITTTSVPCATTNPVSNSNFNSLAGWTVVKAGDGDAVLGNAGPGAAGGGVLDVTSSKETQRVLQTITVCPGAKYSVTFQARRILASGSGAPGTVTAKLYVNDQAYAGGDITNTNAAWVAPPSIGGGIFTAPANSNSAILKLEFTYTTTGGLKEVWVDNVQLTLTN